jgi:hypothetical protein
MESQYVVYEMLYRHRSCLWSELRSGKLDVILALKKVESKFVDFIHVARGRNWWWTLLTF